jgi:hypothetical protein
LKAGGAPHIYFVLLQDFHRVASDLGLVILNVTGLEEDYLAARFRTNLARPCRPLFEGGGRKVGKQFVAMNAEHFLEKDPMNTHPVSHIGHTQARASHCACAIRV